MKTYLLSMLGWIVLITGAAGISYYTSIAARPLAGPRRLPYLGERLIRPVRSGQAADTVIARIPAFALTDQAGAPVTTGSLAGRVYVANFFFASCPSICPNMQRHVLRVYARYAHDARVAFLSHTIDPAHDSVPVLRAYAERLGVEDARQWHFATAPRDTIFRLARAYATVVDDMAGAPGSLTHGGTLALVDHRGYVRGLYDGLSINDVDRLLHELPLLLRELPASTPPLARARHKGEFEK